MFPSTDREEFVGTNMKSVTWLERIINVFDLVGGEADLTQVYEIIEQKWPEVLTKSWKATVRKEIESHCRNSANFKGDEVFIWVGPGRYRLK
jgi:hypothetical protein